MLLNQRKNIQVSLEKIVYDKIRVLSLMLGGIHGLARSNNYFINESSKDSRVICLSGVSHGGEDAHAVGTFVLDVKDQKGHSYDALVICNAGLQKHPLHTTNISSVVGVYELSNTSRTSIFNLSKYRIKNGRIKLNFSKGWTQSKLKREQRNITTVLVGNIGKVEVSDSVYSFIQEKLKEGGLFSLQKRGTCAKKNIQNAKELKEIYQEMEKRFQNDGSDSAKLEEIWESVASEVKYRYKGQSYDNVMSLIREYGGEIDEEIDMYGDNSREVWLLGKLEKIILDHNEKSWLMAGHSLSEEIGKNKLKAILNEMVAFLPKAFGEDMRDIIRTIMLGLEDSCLGDDFCVQTLTKIKEKRNTLGKLSEFIGHGLTIDFAKSNYENFKLIDKINKAYDTLRAGMPGIRVQNGSPIAHMLQKSDNVGIELKHILSVLEKSNTPWSFEEYMRKISKAITLPSNSTSASKAKGENKILSTVFFKEVAPCSVQSTITLGQNGELQSLTI